MLNWRCGKEGQNATETHLAGEHQRLQEQDGLCLQEGVPGAAVEAHEERCGLSAGALLEQAFHQRGAQPALLLGEEVLQGVMHHLNTWIPAY